MMNLAQLQAAFQAHVLQGDLRIEHEVAVEQSDGACARLGIYAAAYGARLVEVLGESFPAVQSALGERCFARVIGSFVRQHPSRFRSARDYGEQLAPWLAANLHGARAPGIADLARFEWAVAAAFDAADGAAIGPAQLAGLSPGQWPHLHFTFSATVRRLDVRSNAAAWWRFACAAQPRPSRWRATCAQHWLVWRQELAVFYRRLSRAETQALDAALAGHSFGQLCGQLQPAQAATFLHGWLTAGLITAAISGGVEA